MHLRCELPSIRQRLCIVKLRWVRNALLPPGSYHILAPPTRKTKTCTSNAINPTRLREPSLSGYTLVRVLGSPLFMCCSQPRSIMNLVIPQPRARNCLDRHSNNIQSGISAEHSRALRCRFYGYHKATAYAIYIVLIYRPYASR